MIGREELTDYLHKLLCCGEFQDYTTNGLQVEGKPQIGKICTAVTACEEAINRAANWGADALIVHHGYFWKGEEAVITGMKRQRIKALISHDMNLFAYHLPLDCHPEHGNNACLAKLLDIRECQRHKVANTNDLLWSGLLAATLDADKLKQTLSHKLKREPLHIAVKDKPIHKLAWCTGAGEDFIVNAARLGADAYISGEISERTYYQAIELGIHYFSCGHHATERYGIQSLGHHLAKHHGLEHQYIETNNPV